MSKYSCSKQYIGSSVKHILHNSDDESAARTRPFSFEDIMLRRKSKGSAVDAEGGAVDAMNRSGREGVDKDISHHRESEGHSRHSKGSSLGVQHHSLEKSAKISSRRKKEETLLKDNMEVRRSHRDNHESGLTTKAKQKYDTNRKDKGQKKGQENLVRGKSDQRSRNDTEYETGKKHSRDGAGKDIHEDRGRGKLERESKRKHQNGDGDKSRDRSSAKKHDRGKHHDLENRERKESRISLSSHYEESRLKRRQKRSQDRENKHRRTVSLSPRAHKHSTKLERPKELPLDSHVKKPERWRSDNDKTGDSTNASSGQYRRHSGSTSGLGGYSPRKRRIESAIKTPPPPPVRSPEKKNAGWDLLPAAKVGLFSGSVPSTFQPSNHMVSSRINDLSSGVPASPAMGKPTSGVSSNNLATKTNTSLDLIQLTQATRPMRRLYIENLPHSASEKAVIECLNRFLMYSGVNHTEGNQPCISCIIHKDKGQALVEFLTPEYASVALSFDGSYFSGSILKIRRPKDFVEIVTGDLDKSVKAESTISDVVEDSPNKILIAGISNAISPKMLRDIITAFGPLKAYHFGINEDLNEPCAFLEYVDQSVMLKACAGLNGMKIGGQVLKVFPAVPFSLSSEYHGCQPCYGIPEHVKPLLQQPTLVLKFKNVFNAEVLPILPESDVGEILEDISIECARFGTVKSVNVVKHCNSCVNGKEEYKDTDDVEIKHEFQGSLDNCTNDSEIEDVKNLEDDKVNLDNCTDDGRCPNEVLEEKVSRMGNDDVTDFEDLDCKNTLDRNPQGIPKQISSPANEFESRDAKVAKIIETDENSLDNKLSPRDDSTVVKTDSEKMKVLHGLDILVKSDTDAFEKSKEKDPNNNLESEFTLGSVFVEYSRLEASCMAAHALHGRIYDGQEISIEYVALDLYRKRFPK